MGSARSAVIGWSGQRRGHLKNAGCGQVARPSFHHAPAPRETVKQKMLEMKSTHAKIGCSASGIQDFVWFVLQGKKCVDTFALATEHSLQYTPSTVMINPILKNHPKNYHFNGWEFNPSHGRFAAARGSHIIHRLTTKAVEGPPCTGHQLSYSRAKRPRQSTERSSW